MPHLQPLCKNANGGVLPLWKALDRQQSLMLVRLHAGFSRSLLAEIQKAPDLVAKCGERSVVFR